MPLLAHARPSLAALLVVLAAAVSVLVCGCGKPGPGTPIELNGDPAMGDLSTELAMSGLSGDGWQSAPWTGAPWIAYSPRAQIRITHPLGRTPRTVLVYLSFVEEGTTPALAAGDLARVLTVTSSEITIWNDTNGTYFARVVIE